MTDLDASDDRPTSEIGPVLSALLAARRVVLTTHVEADGDAVGSEVALGLGLRALGKTVVIANLEPISTSFSMLSTAGLTVLGDTENGVAEIRRADLVVVLDNNSWERLGPIGAAIRDQGRPVACIDHHVAERPFCDLHLLDLQAASTGEIVLRILDAAGAAIDADIATALFLTLVTDTGWFRHPNTSRTTLLLAARLLELGARRQEIQDGLAYQETLPRLRLAARLLERVQAEQGGAFVWALLTRRMLDEFGIRPRQGKGLIDRFRYLRGAYMAALFTEVEGGVVEMSLRSREPWCALDVAAALGGGGHRHAAGARHVGGSSALISRVVAEVAARRSGWEAAARDGFHT